MTPSVEQLEQRYLEKRRAFCDELRRLRVQAGLSQAGLVKKVESGLSLNAYKKYEWQGGDSLPAEDRVTLIIAAFGEGAEHLATMREEASQARLHLRNHGRHIDLTVVERYEPWEGYTARELFRRSIQSVEANCFAMDIAEGKVIGWRQFLENEQLPITALSSAYGLRILIWANHAGSIPSIGKIRDSILLMENEGGGWGARTQNRLSRVEAYGPILLALRLAGLSDSELDRRVDHYEEILDRSHDPATWEHTAILTVAGSTLASVRPESHRVPELLEALAKAACEDADGVYWTESLVDSRREQLRGSAAHTARALVAIGKAPPETTSGMEDLVVKAVRWLEQRKDYGNDQELIERSNPSDPEFLLMRHFTAAWVARAFGLASRWTPPDLDALKRIEDVVLRQVGQDGLWRWKSGEIPIWMTDHGLQALDDIARTQHDLTRS